MKKLSSSLAARITPATFLLATIVTLTLLFGSAQLGVAESLTPQAPPTPTPTFVSLQATITTANCNVPGGLCQSGNPANCNGGQGPNNGAGTGNCPPCNNGAGPNPLPSPGISATVTLCEIGVGYSGTGAGAVLTASGYGTGFQFGKPYISLIYFNNNAATCSRMQPGYPPTLQNIPLWADNDFGSMMLGFWKVYPDGHATLDVVKQATVSGLNNYTTVSVREMQPPNLICFNCGLDPAPQLNALRACGPLVAGPGCSIP
jgi:hypothetical protein